MMVNKKTEKQLIYLTGSGRSGSTLLDIMLSQHSDIAALGEIHRLYLNANKNTAGNRCTCGQSVKDCPFWKEVERELQALTNEDMRLGKLITTDPAYLKIPDNNEGTNIVEPIPSNLYRPKIIYGICVIGCRQLFKYTAKFFTAIKKHHDIALNSHLLYESVRRATKKSTIVDSTKTPTRLKTLYMTTQAPFKVIYLVRDGRAVTSARMGRQGIGMERAATIWKSEHRKIRAVLATIPDCAVFEIHYEELCLNTRATLTALCDFLGIKFEDNMMKIDKIRSHSLGGNPMRWRKAETQITLDEKWKTELGYNELLVFNKIAGKQNRDFGYT